MTTRQTLHHGGYHHVSQVFWMMKIWVDKSFFDFCSVYTLLLSVLFFWIFLHCTINGWIGTCFYCWYWIFLEFICQLGIWKDCKSLDFDYGALQRKLASWFLHSFAIYIASTLISRIASLSARSEGAVRLILTAPWAAVLKRWSPVPCPRPRPRSHRIEIENGTKCPVRPVAGLAHPDCNPDRGANVG
jgi:hypothetical protein